MLQRLAVIAACAAVAAQLLRASWDATVCVEPGDEIPKLEAPRGDGCWVAVNATVGAKWATGYLGACASQDFDIKAATPWTLHCAAVASCRWHARRRGDELAVCSGDRLAALTHFVATRLLGKCQLPWEAYMTWFARAPDLELTFRAQRFCELPLQLLQLVHFVPQRRSLLADQFQLLLNLG